jgi:hypothetical protein
MTVTVLSVVFRASSVPNSSSIQAVADYPDFRRHSQGILRESPDIEQYTVLGNVFQVRRQNQLSPRVKLIRFRGVAYRVDRRKIIRFGKVLGKELIDIRNLGSPILFVPLHPID